MSATVLAHYPRRRAAHGLHRCDDCGGRIAARDRYSDQRLVYDGSAYAWREHALCRALFEQAWADLGDVLHFRGERNARALAEWWANFVATFAPGAVA